ncbi:hypothetical protein ACFVUY_24660 [Kitasatospora sp. NPDC058063]|uniref:hypothetical protein n=1 Tax=unclassified Kitasatospora TaxID=2633591 RepID=UPI0036D8EA8D
MGDRPTVEDLTVGAKDGNFGGRGRSVPGPQQYAETGKADRPAAGPDGDRTREIAGEQYAHQASGRW